MSNSKKENQDQPELAIRDKEKEKLTKFDSKGVQTLFRTLSRNHYNLLRMVDSKASIILTMNSIIISLLMGVIFMAPSEQREVLEVGSKILLNCGMASMVFALLAMLPHKYIKMSQQPAAYKGSLYAQNFSKLSLEDYRKEMQRVMSSGNAVYSEMIDDLYYLGKSVAIKQKLILVAVIFFLVGLVITILNTIYHGVMIEEIFFK